MAQSRLGSVAAMILAPLVVALAGCAGVATTPSETALPDGVEVSIYQGRAGMAIRQLEVRITNDSDAPLEITRLEFRSDQFIEPTRWEKAPATVLPGVSVDLSVPLPEPRCDVDEPTASVEFDYTVGDATATVVSTPIDLYSRMPVLREEDCFAVGAREIVTLTAATAPRQDVVGGIPVARLDIAATPTGADGSIVVGSLSGTTLLTPVDPSTGARVTSWDIGATIAGTDAPTTIELTLAPARCDLHAIAEDKRGTILPLTAEFEGKTGRVLVAAAPEVRDALYDFVLSACAAQ